ncbi:MAG TPA: LuxR C-terminal-related transcriptional regulator, partial [Acidimicrobiales bacterium]
APLAERLARTEYPDPTAALVLGQALTALRRGQEAEAILAPLMGAGDTAPGADAGGGAGAGAGTQATGTGATTTAGTDGAEGADGAVAPAEPIDDALVVQLAVARLAAHRSPQLSLSAARQLAAETATRVEAPRHRQLLQAALADTLGFRGRIAEAGELALPLLDAEEPEARAMAVGPACRWLVHTGRAEDAVVVGRNALADAFAGAADSPWAPGVVVGNLGVALLATGRLDELTELCNAADPPTAVPGRLQGLVTLLRGAGAMLAGRPATARGLLREAVLSFERADEVGHRSWALALLAEAEAMLGEIADAEQAIAAIPSRNSTHVHFDRRRTSLLVRAAAGEVGWAARQAIELADEARVSKSPFFELTSAYTAMRLGAVEEARRVVSLAPSTQGLLTAAFADHAAALLRDDGDRLDQAATTFHRLGMRVLAAEAAVHASLAYRRAGLGAKARAASTRAAVLHSACEGARTPILAQGTSVADLTRREREVALLAAQGMTSRRIADKLGVSVRTVDNQLGRVYTKLGVAGRRELASVVDRLAR